MTTDVVLCSLISDATQINDTDRTPEKGKPHIRKKKASLSGLTILTVNIRRNWN